MSKVSFTNQHPHPVYSTDGTLVQPGETRMVNVIAVATAPPAAPPPDALLDLLDNKVPDIIPHLVNMGLDDLRRILAAEKDGKTRKSMVEALELRIMEAEDAPVFAAEADPEDAGDGA